MSMYMDMAMVYMAMDMHIDMALDMHTDIAMDMYIDMGNHLVLLVLVLYKLT